MLIKQTFSTFERRPATLFTKIKRIGLLNKTVKYLRTL